MNVSLQNYLASILSKASKAMPEDIHMFYTFGVSFVTVQFAWSDKIPDVFAIMMIFPTELLLQPDTFDVRFTSTRSDAPMAHRLMTAPELETWLNNELETYLTMFKL